MKILVPPDLSKKLAKANVPDSELKNAVLRAERGLIDARIGKYLIKQRVPREGQGRSKGFRTVICYKIGDFAVFLHMFAKSNKPNLSDQESEEYNFFANKLADLSDENITRLAKEHDWREIE
ncbi:type II toxin-antitoxin system RelE/ParE family toxin [Methylobacterium sp. J-090]|uniref:type II toxin-antitoxin system RelE/ParE family toxin n=1 Tax=Methylobacterium sp. J-090 TaxID=2836666 RepID=UPI001FB88412|nr:type II toxin-antitoxin system RelE/ParE family toxin [Methylobacterium sp. J-090]MCJ2084319.1 type II toxin-antitoxin system RelE/ParE family toxin [Methylobacterium sp. J-090]